MLYLPNNLTRSPIFRAITNNIEVVGILLEAGADVGIINDDGNSVMDLVDEQPTATFINAFIENLQIIKYIGESPPHARVNKTKARII